MLVPVERRYTYDDTRGFSEIVAGAIARTHRGLATTEWSKAKRRGVLIDSNQNGEGKTIASAYSVRPRPGAPVSTPLRWDEVNESLDPAAFTMDVVLERVRRHGDLFEGVLTTRQRIDKALKALRYRPILWDVDTQVDFMEPSGSSTSRTRGSSAGDGAAHRRRARGRRRHVASADDHELTDPEISDSPDLRHTFPPHCLRGTRGAEKILETKQRDPLPLSLVPFPPGLVPGMIEGKREILLLKKNFDVFTNPNTQPLLEALDPDEIVVFGVATDVCDDAAIRGSSCADGASSSSRTPPGPRRGANRRVRCVLARRRRPVTTAEEVIASLG